VLGAGRPGWHIECTAIALDRLGAGFDVQAGGSDLIFPHHEMCAAQGRVATDQLFAQAYLHSGMVGLDGEKMSKSKGNLVFVSALRESGVDPMVIRLALLGHHYRDDWEWSDELLVSAQGRLSRWREAVRLPAGLNADEVLVQLRAALAQDLDAPAALAAVDAWAGASMAIDSDDAEAPALVARACEALLGVTL
jgi:L-cysteine:1D-myo-inositol 2-amino-2-deoxy-alpha-D-glucopyranoside ligase